MADDKITHDELVALFGKQIPMEAVQLLLGPDATTTDNVRAALRVLADRYTASALADVFAATIPQDLRHYTREDDGPDDIHFHWTTPTFRAVASVERGTRQLGYAWIGGSNATPGADDAATVDAFPPDLAAALRAYAPAPTSTQLPPNWKETR